MVLSHLVGLYRLHFQSVLSSVHPNSQGIELAQGLEWPSSHRQSVLAHQLVHTDNQAGASPHQVPHKDRSVLKWKLAV